MNIELTNREFRTLLDLVYIGNWILNSTRVDDRIEEYDNLESKIFALCKEAKMSGLAETRLGVHFPSRAFEQGGIQDAIAYYEDGVFFDILAEELSKRDMGYPDMTPENFAELHAIMDIYMEEFNAHGLDRIYIDEDEE